MYGKIAENHYGIPQDVEWGIVNGIIYILQSRPITTIGNKKEAKSMAGQKPNAKIILQGQGASPGIASGRVVVIRDVKDTGRVKEGDILVTKMTSPDMVPVMRKVAAIITDEGGLTCHAAIVSRELGTPGVVGTKTATHVLTNGQLITVDGEKGLIYEGEIAQAAPAPTSVVLAGVAGPSKIITATSVKVNVSIPEAAARAAATGADGVGLLRIEHLILGLNKTPSAGLSPTTRKRILSGNFTMASRSGPSMHSPVNRYGCGHWMPRLMIFRNMMGGENEPIEHNPMLGWRGSVAIREPVHVPSSG